MNASSKWVPFESGVEPLADNILLNGQHVYSCNVVSTTYPPDLDHDHYARKSDDSSACTGSRLYTTKVKPGTKLRLRLINSSSFLSYWVSIDNHTLTVVELDGVEIEPLAGQRGVYLNIGQRVSVIVDADQPAAIVLPALRALHERRAREHRVREDRGPVLRGSRGGCAARRRPGKHEQPLRRREQRGPRRRLGGLR